MRIFVNWVYNVILDLNSKEPIINLFLYKKNKINLYMKFFYDPHH